MARPRSPQEDGNVMNVRSLILVPVVLCAGCVCAGTDYLSPSDVIADPAGKFLYVSEATAKQVAVWDVAAEKLKGVIKLPDVPGGLAMARDGSALYVSLASPNGRIGIVNVNEQQLAGMVDVGHTPGAMAIAPKGDRLYVCNRFDNNVSVVSLATRRETKKIPVLREPAGICVTPGEGRYLFVANSLPAGPATSDSVAAAVSVIDTAEERNVADIALRNGATDLHGICIAPDGQYAYVVHALSRYYVPATQLERGWMNTNALSILDVTRKSLIDTVLLDELNHGAANPWGVACSADGKQLCITHAGTHEMSVIDRTALHRKLDEARTSATLSPTIAVADDLTFLDGVRRRVPLAGKGPRGVAVVGAIAYAAEYFTDSLGALDLRADAPEARSLALGPDKPLTSSRLGEMMFHDARRCFQNWQSCATCHPGGRADALNWDLLNDGIGNPKNNRSLLYADKRKPVMSLGARESSKEAVHAGFKAIQFAQVSDEENAAVLEYLKGLKPVPSPHLVNGKLSPAAQRGKKIFASAGCGKCHSGEYYTDLKGYNLGYGIGPDRGKPFITAPLQETWRTAPYLYDGRAATMREVFTTFNKNDQHGVTTNLTTEQLDELVEYVLSL